MGSCSSTTTTEENDEIENYLTQSALEQNHIKKIVLLGPKLSGKSTILKQLYRVTRQDEETNTFVHTMRQHIINAMMTLLRKSQELYDSDTIQFKDCLIDTDDEHIHKAIQCVAVAARQFSMSEETANVLVFGYVHQYDNTMDMLIPSDILTAMIVQFYYILFEQREDEMKQLAESINILWWLPAVQNTFEYRGGKYSLMDNMDYFFNDVMRIFSSACCDMKPNFEDYIKCNTKGPRGLLYDIKEVYFNIVECRHRKWILFDRVSAVIFVAPLGDFNVTLFENEHKNALHESIELFHEVRNCKWFIKSEMILFLNKDDLYRDKLRNGDSLKEYFDECDIIQYEQKDDYEEDRQFFDMCYEQSIAFIQDQFIQPHIVRHSVVFCHIVCALDEDCVQKAMWDVQNIIVRTNLRRSAMS